MCLAVSLCEHYKAQAADRRRQPAVLKFCNHHSQIWTEMRFFTPTLCQLLMCLACGGVFAAAAAFFTLSVDLSAFEEKI